MAVWDSLRSGRCGLVLFGTVAVALALRLYGLNWDDGHLFHPDERHILMVTQKLAEKLALSQPLTVDRLLRADSPLNPQSFAYGSFPFYLLLGASSLLGWLGSTVPPLGFLEQLGSFGGMRLVGRTISTLFDVGTVLLVYVLGRRLYGRWVGLLGAAFVALAVMHVQLSHFYASDTILTFFVLATLLCLTRVIREGTRRWSLLAGVAVGLALASKVSAAPIVAAVGLAYVLRVLAMESGTALKRRPEWLAELRRVAPEAVVTLVAGLVTFVVFEPYALIDFRTFVQHVAEQGAMVRGIADLPYTRQYANRTPYLYFLENLTVFGLGLPLGLAALGGWLYVLVRAARAPRLGDLLLLSWVVPYFAVTGPFHAKFLRYLLPITPLLCLFAAEGLFRLWHWAGLPQPAAAGPMPDPPSQSAGLDLGKPAASIRREVEVPAEEARNETGQTRPPAESPALRLPDDRDTQTDEPAQSDGLPDFPDEERRRWAELKGLSLAFLRTATEEGTRVGPGSKAQDEEVENDEEAGDWESTGRGRPPWLRPAISALVAVVIGLTALNALAFVRIYAEPHPAVTASRWIYEHVPPGAGIATEHWEEGMPVPIAEDGRSLSAGSQGYRMVTLNLYENDDEAKLNHIVQQLEAADYVVFFSNRLYSTIPRLPQRYPMTAEYYRLLFGERLGYELVAAFTSYPNALGIALVDDTLSDAGLPTPALLAGQSLSPVVLSLGHADETFSVYDHPKVLIFQRMQRVSDAEIRGRLRTALAWRGTADEPEARVQSKSLMLTPAERAANAAGGTFRELFNRDDFANQWPVLVWVLMAEALGLAAAPLAFAVCRGLADRGYLLAKTLGVLVLSWLAWMLVGLELLPNGRLPVYLALALLVAGGAVALVLQWEGFSAFVRARRGLLLMGEVAFWGAFLLFLTIRMANPDLWHPARGGEKPMDLAYLMATIKSTTFPPYDPWFAGGYLNYYYYGQIIVATLVKLSGVVPTTAYNLVVPHLFALTVAGAFTVACNLIGEEAGAKRAIWGGLAAAGFLSILGNLGGGGQLAEQFVKVGNLSYRGAVPGLTELVQLAYGLVLVVLGRPLHVPTDWYWPSTRVIPGTINEFPFFTFLYADLHAHMIGLPLTLLALGLAVSTVKVGLQDWQLPARPRPAGVLGFTAPLTIDLRSVLPGLKGGALARPVLSLLVLGLVVGALMPTNSWDYPTYLGVVGLALLIPWYLSRERTLGVLGALILRIAAIGVLSYVLYLPFHRHFQSFYFGVKPTPDRSPLAGYLVIHGLFLAALLTFVAFDFFRHFGRNGTVRYLGLLLRRWDRLPRLLALRRLLVRQDDEAGAAGLILALGALAVGALLALLGMPLVGLLVLCLVLVAALALRRDRPAEESFLLVLFGIGLALGIATELVAIDGDVGRMNTVFKFYMQVWVMWSIGAAVALARSWHWLTGGSSTDLKRIWLGVLAVLLLFSTVYPLVGAWARVRDRFDTSIPATLDGTAYMQAAVYVDQNRPIQLASDLAAIRWLQDNVVGSPAILEGHAPLYRWGARVSIYTGLPTVIGWDWHQKQQRWGYQEQIDERVQDVRSMYADSSVSRTLALFRKYSVAYVYVGEMERIYYPAAGLAKLDQMVGKHLELVYDQQGVRIYRVVAERA